VKESVNVRQFIFLTYKAKIWMDGIQGK